MVAVRRKVGAKGVVKTAALAKGKKIVKIDCSVPSKDGIFDADMTNAFEQFFQENIKLHGKKGKLADKVKINFADDVLSISTTMKYKKKYFKYLTKKFLKKKMLRDWLRILSTGKGAYTLKYFNIQDNEEEEEE